MAKLAEQAERYDGEDGTRADNSDAIDASSPFRTAMLLPAEMVSFMKVCLQSVLYSF
jgi:hypothetical protein